jgi:hypothetical protein
MEGKNESIKSVNVALSTEKPPHKVTISDPKRV